MKTKSIATKLAIITTSVAFIALAAVSVIAVINMNGLISGITRKQALAANQSFAQFLDEYNEDALIKAGEIAAVPATYEAIRTGNTALLTETITDMGVGVDFVTVADSTGVVLARNYSDKKGDDITNQKVISTAIATGSGTSAVEPGTQIPLAVRASSVVKDDAGKLLAVVSCGFDLSENAHVDRIKEISDCEVTLFSGDNLLNTTVMDDTGARMAGTKADPAIADKVLNRNETHTGRMALFGQTFEVCYTPLVVDSETIGMLFAGVNIEDTMTQQNMEIAILSGLAIIMMIILAVIVITYSKTKISRPLSVLSAAMYRFGTTGDLTLSNEDVATIKEYSVIHNDIGAVIKNTSEFVMHMIEVGKVLETIAGGDLTAEVNALSDRDTISLSMKKMTGSLNKMFEEINMSSMQVTVGSGQIANSSQALAQGATEQAASVQQLYASIGEVSDKTKHNSSLANDAASMSAIIRVDAENGTKRMDSLINAVAEISEAGHSIGKVIKIIDDIAFQTNILALNAAVEAARAGQHGKGFAVVADEVRSLAAKSAEAAKETGGMLANTIEKSDLGMRIATDASEALKKIVDGVRESTEIINKIAVLSEEQTLAISHIDKGISQISQIVQQNSATAEEEAAASQEMSSQAGMLQQMISRFKIDGDMQTDSVRKINVGKSLMTIKNDAVINLSPAK